MRIMLVALMLAGAVPVTAQTVDTSVGQGTPAGHVASSTVGEVGQRLTREESAQQIEPLGRVESRIQNRVQSRIRNRIDRYYNPQANATSPFEIAGQQARKAGKPNRH
jgi:hypothetical protein